MADLTAPELANLKATCFDGGSTAGARMTARLIEEVERRRAADSVAAAPPGDEDRDLDLDVETVREGVAFADSQEVIEATERLITRLYDAAPPAGREDEAAVERRLLRTESGQVAWEIDVEPHSAGEDGRAWEKGVGSPAEAQAALRCIADEVDGWIITAAATRGPRTPDPGGGA